MLFTAIILLWISANMNWGDGRWNQIVKTDGNGYYAYLPALFIYQDLSFSFFDDNANSGNEDGYVQDFRIDTKDGIINKYFAGIAVAQAPFFLMGHLANLITGNPLDGYSVYYLIFFQIGTICYALLSQYLLILILRRFSIPDVISSFTACLMIFATNVYIYIVSEPSLSHIHSLTFVNLFILSFLKFFESKHYRYFISGMIALGMIVLIRPVNGLIIFSLPFLSMSFQNYILSFQKLIRQPGIFFLGILIPILLISIQLIIYKMQTGHFWIYSYGGEQFQLTQPNMLKFMFSYKKGFFLYTPLLFLSLFGTYFIYQKSKYRFIALFSFLGLVVYILSSWWMWYYGGSFSSRVMIEYYTFFFIPLALLLKESKFRKTFVTLSIVLLLICQIQSYQYRYGYLHWSEMNKDRYWDNFLRIDKLIKKEKDW